MSPEPNGRRTHPLVNPRIVAVGLHDLFMAAASFEIAVWLRYLTYGAPQDLFFLWHGTAIFTVICAVVFWRTGLYRGIWHYASLSDLMAIVKAVTLALLVFLPVMFVFDRLANFPRSAMLINWPLLVVMLAAPRLIYRYLKDGNLRAVFERADDTRVPVLLVGAGNEAETFIREMGRSRLAGYRAVGIVDHKVSRLGRDIRGVRVLGVLDEIPEVVAALERKGQRPQRFVITSSRIDGQTVGDLLDVADRLGMSLSRMPRMTDFRAGDGGAEPDIRPVDVEDLLRRPQRVLDRDAMRRLIAGRRVLITGAGGTIGNELVRQVAALNPRQLTLVENNEHALYRVDLEVSERWPALSRTAILGDVRDAERVRVIFERERPQLVFHAAAFKHVPIVEANPNEGLLTNIVGTRNVAEACNRSGVDVMVMVSTDKAVNPTSVMGASKRVAEMICQGLNVRGGLTRYVTVRFGNVLGSTGSVVPLFERQLKRGGPLTVTHPDVSRFFMTTREAVELILQATAAGPSHDLGGRIFVLDMGEPVRIQDLARQMIRLAERRPDVDVALAFTGLRPGEKLHEELLHDGEAPVATDVDGVRLATPRLIDYDLLKPQIARLEAAALARHSEEALEVLRKLVPEYRSAGTPARTAPAAEIGGAAQS